MKRKEELLRWDAAKRRWFTKGGETRTVYVRAHYRRPPKPKTYAEAMLALEETVLRVMRRFDANRSTVMQVTRRATRSKR